MCRHSKTSQLFVFSTSILPVNYTPLKQLREDRALTSRLEKSALETAVLPSPLHGVQDFTIVWLLT